MFKYIITAYTVSNVAELQIILWEKKEEKLNYSQ